jgi:predicted ATPase/DNA-binding CsgD family transcriptional regulator/Tfp pilus assembly protein PilF
VVQHNRSANTGHLPRQLTSFIGREQELAELDRLLADPACRLLTLVGPGGIGKTRLAIEAAAPAVGAFAAGVRFVNLQPVSSIETLVTAIADALDFPLSGQDDPLAQLTGYLRDKEVLLLLDNVEHLIPANAADALLELLKTAPQVKMLLTSRAVLSIQEEWVFHVSGLSFPEKPEDWAKIEGCSAVQLFADRARRVRHNFALARDLEDVVRICRSVEGIPLAIEMAASWTKTLSCAEIADEVQRSIEFLGTTLRDVPERHRSMQAVFDHSWQSLNEDERDAFKRLSVFRGGFRRHAAERVAGASLTILSALVDKSLARWDPAGRYQIHELLRQLSESHLVQASEEAGHVRHLHANYYADFLHQRLPSALGHRQSEVVIEIEGELENVRAAWDWMVEHGDVEALDKSARTLAAYGLMRCRYLEIAQALEKAISRLDAMAATASTRTREIDVALAPMLSSLGWFYIRFGQFGEVEVVLQRCCAIYQRLGIPPVSGAGTDPALGLGMTASIRGDYDAAIRFGVEALQSSETHDHAVNRAYAYSVLASAAQAKGEYEQAQHYAQQALALTQQTGDRWFAPHFGLGNAALALGDYSSARRHFESFYEIRKEFDDRGGMATALNRLGDVALREGDHAQAQRLYCQALDLRREVNDKGGRATSLNGLGQVALAAGDDEQARQRLREALQIAHEIDYVPLIFSTLVGSGELLLRVGKTAFGFDALALALHHSACPRETKERAQGIVDAHTAASWDEGLTSAMRHAHEHSLDAMIESVLTTLAVPIAHSKTTQPKLGHDATPMQALFEPLTPRELEVMKLIATGLSNKDIADRLVISVGTVKAYTGQIYGKLGVNSRTQAVARARELSLLA